MCYPSSFRRFTQRFDELLLLKSGSRVVYHGSLGKDSRHLIDYFEHNEAKKCPKSMNPAEYMLEAIGAGDPNYKSNDWGDIWENSSDSQEHANEIQTLLEERYQATCHRITMDGWEFAMPSSTQIVVVVKRCFARYWRTPQYIISKFALHSGRIGQGLWSYHLVSLE
jgi:ATP-binding cassette, subfamily G (WHITE), member 2, SNQ2